MGDTEIGRDTIQKISKKSQIFDELLSQPGAFYTFCYKLCLEMPQLAQKLFALTIKHALTTGRQGDEAVDQWFFRGLHQQWGRFCRFKRDLRETTLKISFNWVRPMGSQHNEALRLLTPAEREIVLYRLQAKHTLSQIQKITGYDAVRVESLFAAAMAKIMPP